MSREIAQESWYKYFRACQEKGLFLKEVDPDQAGGKITTINHVLAEHTLEMLGNKGFSSRTIDSIHPLVIAAEISLSVYSMWLQISLEQSLAYYRWWTNCTSVFSRIVNSTEIR